MQCVISYILSTQHVVSPPDLQLAGKPQAPIPPAERHPNRSTHQIDRDLVFCVLQVCKISNILRLHSHSSFPLSLLVRLIHTHGNLLYSCYQM